MDSFFSSLQTLQKSRKPAVTLLASSHAIQVNNAVFPALILFRITAHCGLFVIFLIILYTDLQNGLVIQHCPISFSIPLLYE